ncbi:hypothetical protein GGX14DRAFT_566621 [Mycena pura]|uniref:Uncharacterized protein n=1 Tax=Mycena pura TaxID=153505 RepID=A0AAD6VEF0_9AGAR|nr:hypothetical protein GGX14DRAFT_566621 [Mycena pura]
MAVTHITIAQLRPLIAGIILLGWALFGCDTCPPAPLYPISAYSLTATELTPTLRCDHHGVPRARLSAPAPALGGRARVVDEPARGFLCCPTLRQRSRRSARFFARACTGRVGVHVSRGLLSAVVIDEAKSACRCTMWRFCLKSCGVLIRHSRLSMRDLLSLTFRVSRESLGSVFRKKPCSRCLLDASATHDRSTPLNARALLINASSTPATHARLTPHQRTPARRLNAHPFDNLINARSTPHHHIQPRLPLIAPSMHTTRLDASMHATPLAINVRPLDVLRPHGLPARTWNPVTKPIPARQTDTRARSLFNVPYRIPVPGNLNDQLPAKK